MFILLLSDYSWNAYQLGLRPGYEYSHPQKGSIFVKQEIEGIGYHRIEKLI
ncbi:hypothetical protein NRIC_33930 [Enterococcus florum]|uniref:Uncharacterized protein n=1 Tax=Enterococcus florum TaxID=2480627 RepID=A0A4P5PIT9_9ENTE|nr:hypothetical protein NRIC_33930 [Enterococcus florum]